MQFHFPLDRLLRLRRSLEKHEEQRLYSLASAVNRIRNEIEEVEQARLCTQRLLVEEGASGASLQYAAHCAAVSAANLDRLCAQLAVAEKARLEQLSAYRIARQRREILEGLREREEKRHELELARKQREQIDEDFAMRRYLSTVD